MVWKIERGRKRRGKSWVLSQSGGGCGSVNSPLDTKQQRCTTSISSLPPARAALFHLTPSARRQACRFVSIMPHWGSRMLSAQLSRPPRPSELDASI